MENTKKKVEEILQVLGMKNILKPIEQKVIMCLMQAVIKSRLLPN